MAVVQRERAGRRSKQNREENKGRNISKEEKKGHLSKNVTLTSSWSGSQAYRLRP
jgi:hypothetical protein